MVIIVLKYAATAGHLPPKNDMNLLKADVWFRGNSQPVSLSLYSFSSQC